MSAVPARTDAIADPGIRQRRAAQVAGWSLVALGAGHLLTVAATGTAGQDEPTRRALDGLSTVRVGLPGPRPTLAELFNGYSLMMGVMVATAGGLLLILADRAASASSASSAAALLRPALWLTVAVSSVGLVISLRSLPFPPLIGLSVALAACVVGLVGSRR